MANMQQACAEIANTTVGFTGPRDRMTILKSYNGTPVEAQSFETVFMQTRKILDMTVDDPDAPTSRYGIIDCECIQRALMPVDSCEEVYAGLAAGEEAEASSLFLGKVQSALAAGFKCKGMGG